MLSIQQCANLVETAPSVVRNAIKGSYLPAKLIESKIKFHAVSVEDLVTWAREQFDRTIDLKQAYAWSKRNREEHLPDAATLAAARKPRAKGCDTCRWGTPMAASETGHFCEASAFRRCVPWIHGHAWEKQQ